MSDKWNEARLRQSGRAVPFRTIIFLIQERSPEECSQSRTSRQVSFPYPGALTRGVFLIQEHSPGDCSWSRNTRQVNLPNPGALVRRLFQSRSTPQEIVPIQKHTYARSLFVTQGNCSRVCSYSRSKRYYDSIMYVFGGHYLFYLIHRRTLLFVLSDTLADVIIYYIRYAVGRCYLFYQIRRRMLLFALWYDLTYAYIYSMRYARERHYVFLSDTLPDIIIISFFSFLNVDRRYYSLYYMMWWTLLLFLFIFFCKLRDRMQPY